MSTIGVTIDGIKGTLENITLTQNRLAKKVSMEVQRAGLRCQKGAKIACAVDTGRLRNSLLYNKINDYECTVATNVFYAPFLEFGTKKMKARPFLYPAYTQSKREMVDAINSWNLTSLGGI